MCMCHLVLYDITQGRLSRARPYVEPPEYCVAARREGIPGAPVMEAHFGV